VKALKRSGGETGMILYSDRGSQFTSKEFTDFCKNMFVEVNAYAYGWYNNRRPYSHNNGIPPARVS
jgi:transposase InsO family protein